MERVLYNNNEVIANFMKNNPKATIDDVIAAIGINELIVNKYFKKNGLIK